MSVGFLFVTIVIIIQVTAETCTYPDIRLHNNRTNSEGFGTVQLCNSTGHWRSVCDYNWGCSFSTIACRQLGYTNPNRILQQTQFGPAANFGFIGPFSNCPNSYSLSTCSAYSFSTQVSQCNPAVDTVGLKCNLESNCTNGAVRLVNNNQTANTREGRVEYCYQGKWSPFCTSYSSYMTHALAYHLCYELNYRINSYASIFNDGRFGKGSTQNWFRRISCSSGSGSLSQCSVYASSSTCAEECTTQQFGIRCYEPGVCNEGAIRLVNGTVLNEGRLEACVNGVWGSICYNSFSAIDALVVCRELGYTSGGTITSNSAFGTGEGPIVYSYVGCAGHETHMSDCYKSSYRSFTCSRNNNVGVTCWDGCTDGDVRLTGGANPREGTVEVCSGFIWRLVLQVGWNDDESQVVCDQLGYDGDDAESVYDSEFGKPNRSIYLTNVHCDGLEDRLIDCTSSQYSFEAGKSLLPIAQVVGVRCQGNETYRTLDHQLISISTHLTTTGSNIVMTTPHLTEPGLGARESAILGVGVTMIVIAIVAMVIMIVVFFCFIRKRKHSKSEALIPNPPASARPTTQKAPMHNYDTGNRRPQPRPQAGAQKSRGKLPKPPTMDTEVDEVYELS